MNILLVHQYFPKTGWTGGHRWSEFAKLWTKAGHSITVLAGSQHYLSKGEYVKSPWIEIEQPMDGVTVYRSYMSSSYGSGIRGRLISYFSFVMSSIWAVFKVNRPDIIIASSPPLTVAITAIISKIIKRRPLVFEVRDLWLESAIDLGVLKNPAIIKLAKMFEGFTYRFSDCINVLTPAFRTILLEEKGVSENKIVFVPNAADPERFVPGDIYNEIRKRFGWGDKIVSLYAGAMGKANDLIQLVEVADRLRQHKHLHFVIIGDGVERPTIEAEIRRRGVVNVDILDPVIRDEVIPVIQACDITIAILKPVKTFTTVYPNKVFDYMSCAKPVLCVIDGVARQLVEDAGGGVFARPGDIDDIVAKVLYLAEDKQRRNEIGKRGREFVIENFHRGKLSAQYLVILNSIVKEKRDWRFTCT